MINFFKNFSKDESGAVTVDWVVLTAAVVGLAIAAFGFIGTATETVSNNIAADISGVSTGTGTGTGTGGNE